MKTIPYSPKAYRLLHEGVIALAQVEANGVRIDTEYLDDTIQMMERRIKRLTKKLQESDVMQVWKKEYKDKTNINSNEQLGTILFDVMGFECPAWTDKGKFQTNEKALSTIDNPFVKDYIRIKKYQKVLGTYLLGIRREVVNGFLHPSFNLHLVRSYRSSAQNPNFQNIPIRDPKVSKIIRPAFIARPGCRIAEVDYSGLEVSIAACYHHDPTMQEYLEDSTKDMHRDMAMECYMLPLDELTPSDKKDKDEVKRAKNIRYCGKSNFVFPSFYGSWYPDLARNLWEHITIMDLHTRNGDSLIDHLRSKGIRELGDLDTNEKPRIGTFERHIQQVENAFWKRRFPVYDKWRDDQVTLYKKQGWMKSKTGFIYQGEMQRNKIINYPVQGSAFHCLLWSLIRLQKEIKRRGMKALVIGQIHDSIVSDVPDEELDDFLQMVKQITCVDLKDAWDWITVPIEIEAEVTPVDGNWHEKQEVEIP